MANINDLLPLIMVGQDNNLLSQRLFTGLDPFELVFIVSLFSHYLIRF